MPQTHVGKRNPDFSRTKWSVGENYASLFETFERVGATTMYETKLHAGGMAEPAAANAACCHAAPQTPRVLIIDDDPSIQRVMARVLADSCITETAGSGGEALEIIRLGHQFDVILTDQRMPGMTGMEFIAQALRLAPAATYLMLSGNDCSGLPTFAARDRVFRVLTKPSSIQELRDAVSDAYTDALVRAAAACPQACEHA
jgi:CheY-like chemotaxis protein